MDACGGGGPLFTPPGAIDNGIAGNPSDPSSTGTASGTPVAAQVTVGDRVTNRRNDP